MAKVLVVDDDRSVLRLVQKALADSPMEVLAVETAEQGMETLRRENPDVLLLDIQLPETTGIELARQIRDYDARLPVIFITVTDDSGVAIEAMKLGAYEYALKPLGVEQIQDLVERGLHTRQMMQKRVKLHEAEREKPQPPEESDTLVGRSPAMLEVYKQIGRVAAQNVAVLVRGESGTGKELIARAIYQHSDRSDKCFLAVNCAALSDTLLESELFGHEKGAFTGADRRRIGKFEQCHGGTIFLDEVGDMSPLTQSKVLRLLQEQKFERVGDSETIEVDVRVISATNRDLEEMIEENEFRLDLYHRLNAFEIHLPALRDRGEDLDLLIDHFLARFNKRLGKQITGISEDAIRLLRDYRWPGNVRELQSALRKAMLMCTGPVLVPECVPAELHLRGDERTSDDTGSANSSSEADFARFVDERESSDSNDLYAEAVAWMERYLLTRVLRKHGGNQSKAAEQLGITRGSLRYKTKTLGISINQIVSSGDDEDDS